MHEIWENSPLLDKHGSFTTINKILVPIKSYQGTMVWVKCTLPPSHLIQSHKCNLAGNKIEITTC